jgi:hypothetical protein
MHASLVSLVLLQKLPPEYVFRRRRGGCSKATSSMLLVAVSVEDVTVLIS